MTADTSTKFGELSNIVKCMQKCLECTICLEILSVPVKTRCGHLFCYTCIMEVVKKPGASCPLCKISLMRRSISRDEHIEKFIKELDRLIKAIQDDTGIDINSHVKRTYDTKESSETIDNRVYPCTSFGLNSHIEDRQSINEDCQSKRIEKLSSKQNTNSEEKKRKQKNYNINLPGINHVDVLQTASNAVIDDKSAMINRKIKTWLNAINVDDTPNVPNLKNGELQELPLQTCSQIDIANLEPVSQVNANLNETEIYNNASSVYNHQPINSETLVIESRRQNKDCTMKNKTLLKDVPQSVCGSDELFVGNVDKMYKKCAQHIQSNVSASQNIFETNDNKLKDSTTSNLKYKRIHARTSKTNRKYIFSKENDANSKSDICIETGRRSDNTSGEQEQAESVRCPCLVTSSNSTKKTWSTVVQFGKEMRPKTRKLKSLNISIERLPSDTVHNDDSISHGNEKRIMENDFSQAQPNKIRQIDNSIGDNICALSGTDENRSSFFEINKSGSIEDLNKDNVTDIKREFDERVNASDNDRKRESVTKSAVSSYITLRGGETIPIDNLNKKQMANVIGILYSQDDDKEPKNENAFLENRLIDRSDLSTKQNSDQYQDVSDKSKNSGTNLTRSPLALKKSTLSLNLNLNFNEDNLNESFTSNDNLQRHIKLDSKQNRKENLVRNDRRESISMSPKFSLHLTMKDRYRDSNERSKNLSLDLPVVPSFTNQSKLSLRKHLSEGNINKYSITSFSKQNLNEMLVQSKDDHESRASKQTPLRHPLELGRESRLSLARNVIDERCYQRNDEIKQFQLPNKLSLIKNHNEEKVVNNISNVANINVNSENLKTSIPKNSTGRTTKVSFKKLGKIVKDRRKVVRFLYLGSTKPTKLKSLENVSFQNQSTIMHDRQMQTSSDTAETKHISQNCQLSDSVISNVSKKSSKPSVISNVIIKEGSNIQLRNAIDTISNVDKKVWMQSKVGWVSNSLFGMKVSNKVNMLSSDKDSQLQHLSLGSPLNENDSSERLKHFLQKSQSLCTSHVDKNRQKTVEVHLPKSKSSHEIIKPTCSNINTDIYISNTREDEETLLSLKFENSHSKNQNLNMIKEYRYNDRDTCSTFNEMTIIKEKSSLMAIDQETRQNNKNDYEDAHCRSKDMQTIENLRYSSKKVPLSQNELSTSVFRNKRRRLHFSSDDDDDDDDDKVSISNKTVQNIKCSVSVDSNEAPSKVKTMPMLQITEHLEEEQSLHSENEKTLTKDEPDILFQRQNNNEENILSSCAKKSSHDNEIIKYKNRDDWILVKHVMDKKSSCDEESYSNIIKRSKRKYASKDDELFGESQIREIHDSIQCSPSLEVNSELLEMQISPQDANYKVNTEDNLSTEQKKSFRRIVQVSSPEIESDILEITVPLKNKTAEFVNVKQQLSFKTITKDAIPNDNFSIIFSNGTETQASKRKKFSSECSSNDDTDVREIVRNWCDELSSSQRNPVKDHATSTVSAASKNTKIINKPGEDEKSLKVRKLNPSPYDLENQMTSTDDDNFPPLNHIAIHGLVNCNYVQEDGTVVNKRRKLSRIEAYSNSEKDHFCDDILEKFDQIRNHTTVTSMKDNLTSLDDTALSNTSKAKENMIAVSNNLLENASSTNKTPNLVTSQFEVQLKHTNIENKNIMNDNFDEVMANVDTQLLIGALPHSEQSNLNQDTLNFKERKILTTESRKKVIEDSLSENNNTVESNSLIIVSKQPSVIEASIVNTSLESKEEGFQQFCKRPKHSDSPEKDNTYRVKKATRNICDTGKNSVYSESTSLLTHCEENRSKIVPERTCVFDERSSTSVKSIVKDNDLEENINLLSNDQVVDEVQSSQKKEELRKKKMLLKGVSSEDIPQAVNITHKSRKIDKNLELTESFSEDLLMNITQEQLHLKHFEEDLFGAKKSSNAEEDNKDMNLQECVFKNKEKDVEVSKTVHKINNRNETVVEEVDVKNFKKSRIEDVTTTPEKKSRNCTNSSQLLNPVTHRNSPAWDLTPIPKIGEKFSITTPSISSAMEKKSKDFVENIRSTVEGLRPSQLSKNEKRIHSFYESTPKSSRMYGKQWIIPSLHKDQSLQSNPNTLSTKPTNNIAQENVQQQSCTRKLCFVCSGLSSNQIQYIRNFAKVFNAEYTNKFKSEVTHVIVKVYKEKKSTDKTLKYLQGIAHRKWIIGFNWAVKCMEQQKLLNEEEYEIVDETLEAGPRRSRLRQKDLFEGFVFLCMEPFIDISVEQYQDLLLNMGASIVQTLDELAAKKTKLKIIAIQADVHNCETIVKWYEWTKAIVIAHEWIVECISQYQLISFYPYLQELLPQDALALGFPQELVEDDECDIIYETSS